MGKLNKFKYIVPIVFTLLSLSSCKKDKEPSNTRRENNRVNHPYEALRYPGLANYKFKVAGHKMYGDDSGFNVANAILSVEYDDYEAVLKGNLVTTQRDLDYVVCYGSSLNSVLASMKFYENGYISMVNYNQTEYFYKIPEAAAKNIFDVADERMKDFETNAINYEQEAQSDCVPDKFLSKCRDTNKIGEEGVGISYSMDDSFGFYKRDQNDDIYNAIGNINSYALTKHQTIDNFILGARFMIYSNSFILKYMISSYYFCLLISTKNQMVFAKTFLDSVTGTFMFNLSFYDIDYNDGIALYDTAQRCWDLDNYGRA